MSLGTIPYSFFELACLHLVGWSGGRFVGQLDILSVAKSAGTVFKITESDR